MDETDSRNIRGCLHMDSNGLSVYYELRRRAMFKYACIRLSTFTKTAVLCIAADLDQSLEQLLNLVVTERGIWSLVQS